MPFTASEKIRILVKRNDITLTELAERLQTSRQNLNDKLRRDNFTENDLKQIAAALNCTYESVFIMNDTGERI